MEVDGGVVGDEGGAEVHIPSHFKANIRKFYGIIYNLQINTLLKPVHNIQHLTNNQGIYHYHLWATLQIKTKYYKDLMKTLLFLSIFCHKYNYN